MNSNNVLQEMGIKELEHVIIKAKGDDTRLNGRYYEDGEPILYFQNIQVALLSEDTRVVAAQGGFLNQPRVVWEERSNTTFQFSNGTLNPISLKMLLESNMLKQDNPRIPYQELVYLDEQGRGYLTHEPVPDEEGKIFYQGFARENLQGKIDGKLDKQNRRKVDCGTNYANQEIMVNYYYHSKNSGTIYTLSRERKANLYSLEATFYLKDENDGRLHTGILEMPKVYIMSNINLRMGERADPTVGTFRIMAMPENYDGYDSMVWRMTYLDEDIYGI